MRFSRHVSLSSRWRADFASHDFSQPTRSCSKRFRTARKTSSPSRLSAVRRPPSRTDPSRRPLPPRTARTPPVLLLRPSRLRKTWRMSGGRRVCRGLRVSRGGVRRPRTRSHTTWRTGTSQTTRRTSQLRTLLTRTTHRRSTITTMSRHLSRMTRSAEKAGRTGPRRQVRVEWS